MNFTLSIGNLLAQLTQMLFPCYLFLKKPQLFHVSLALLPDMACFQIKSETGKVND